MLPDRARTGLDLGKVKAQCKSLANYRPLKASAQHARILAPEHITSPAEAASHGEGGALGDE